MNRASVISLNEAKIFQSTTLSLSCILPFTLKSSLDAYLTEIDPILKSYEGIDINLATELREGCHFQTIQDVF